MDLQSRFAAEQIEAIMNNRDVVVDKTAVSIFDLTEELDASDAILRLESVAGQLGRSAD